MVRINEKELKELFTELKNENQTALEKIYNKCNKLVYGIAFCILKNKEDAEDVVQTVFSKMHTIDRDKLPISNELSWLYSTTKNEALTVLRKRNNNLDLDSIYEIEKEDNEINKIIDKDSYNRLISKLDNKEKEIISLKILANLSFDEIGKLLNEPTGTIKWRYYKAKNTLKLLLGNLGMSIITFAIGIKILLNNSKIENAIKDEAITEDNTEHRGESVTQESQKEEENKSSNVLDKNEIYEEEKQEIIDQETEEVNINYIGTGMLSVSAMFLMVTIFFTIIFTKYQLKRKNKSSK